MPGKTVSLLLSPPLLLAEGTTKEQVKDFEASIC